MVKITLEMIKAVAPACKNPAAIVGHIQDACDEFGMHNLSQAYAFLANASHESNDFNVFVENLNYSEKGLLATFPKYFDAEQAKAYAKKPEKIANRVYANRLGNGPESSGDGWKHRGIGAIQLTGKANHLSFADYMQMSLSDTIAYIQSPQGRFISAGWFWMMRAAKDLNDVTENIPLTEIKIIDQKTLKTNSKEFDLACLYVNGGRLGKQGRVIAWNRLIKLQG